jgi:hypothetical protein
MPGPPTPPDPPTDSVALNPWETSALGAKLKKLRTKTFAGPPQRGHLRLVASHGEIVDDYRMELPPEESPETERRRFYALMLQKAADMGYKPGWAAYRYREKFKSWPPNEFRSMVV